VPFSVAEAAIAAYLARRTFTSARALARCARGGRPWRPTIAAGALILARDMGIILTGFYILWGWNYARPPIEERLRLRDPAPESKELVASLTADFLERSNALYRDIHQGDDAGIPTQLPDDLAALDAVIEDGWRSLSDDSMWGRDLEDRRGRGKPLLFGNIISYLGISGFYFPFTGEANVNADIPAVGLPHVLAHEKAHQRGIGPEDEANFVGFLAAFSSPDVHARYSASVFAHRQLLRALFTLDRPRAEEILAQRLPGVQRDIDDLNAYWRKFEGPANEISDRVNDAYLKSNRVEGGIASYGRSVDLILRYEASRKNRASATAGGDG
jgi:hypothetical protein